MTGHSPAFEIACRIGLAGTKSGGWSVVIAPSANGNALLRDLQDEFAVQLGEKLRILDAKGVSVTDLRDALQAPGDDIVLVHGLEEWNDSAMEALDISRSAFERSGFVILWLPMAGLVRLYQKAPNVKSWIGASAFLIGPDSGLMSEDERRTRLSELHEYYSLTDEEVIRQAEGGSLPADPEFVEWLILLGRPDLAR